MSRSFQTDRFPKGPSLSKKNIDRLVDNVEDLRREPTRITGGAGRIRHDIVVKINVDNGNGSYSARRQLVSPDTNPIPKQAKAFQWIDHPDDRRVYTVFSATDLINNSSGSLTVGTICIARFDGIVKNNPIYTVYASSGFSALYKITGGPANIYGTYLYGGYKQKWNGSALENDGTVLYLYFPNNTGELPESEVYGHYHEGLDLGWTITAAGVAYPVIICTGHLGQSDFVPPPEEE